MGTPMAHVCKSMLGRQTVSHLRSSPSFGFGTEERMKVSGKSGGLSSSPGPVYYPLSKTYNNYPQSPSHSFGGAHRYTKVSLADSPHRLTPNPNPNPSPNPNPNPHPNKVSSADSTHRTARTGRGDTAPRQVHREAPRLVAPSVDLAEGASLQEGVISQPGKRRLGRATARHAASFVPWPLILLRHSEGLSNPNPNPHPN